MKTTVKELLNARVAAFAAVLAAVVGICAFSFFGLQQDAWAEDAPLATWNSFTGDAASGYTAEDTAANLAVAIKDGKVAITNNTDAEVPGCTISITLSNPPMGASNFVEVEFPDGIAAKGTAEGAYPADSGLEGCEVASAKLMPIPAPAKVTITFETEHGLNDPAYVASMEVNKGETAALPVLAEDGWVFNGWANKAGGPLVTADAVFNEDVTLLADWEEVVPEPTKVTITFETEHGLNDPAYVASMEVNKGETAALPVLAEDGWVFNGWANKVGGMPVTADTVFNEDVILLADWDPATFDVVFKTDKDTVFDTVEVEKGNKFEASWMPEDPKREGFAFGGWYQGETKFEPGTVIDKDITLLAKWNPETPQASESTQPETNKPTTFSIVVTKTANKTGIPLSGAEFTLSDKAGNVLATWTSDGTGKVVELQQDTSYVLTETKAPDGYRREKAININYKDGDVLIDQGAKAISLEKNSDGIASLNVKDLSINSRGSSTATTGDSQTIPLATFFVGAAALLAAGAASFAYRKRTA